MPAGKSQDSATLLDILIDGFEKNEILDGFHWRNLPMPDEAAAGGKFVSWWPDLEIRQAGRGGRVRARTLVRQLVARQADVGRRSDGPAI
jgi:hypothetical protein